MKASPWPSHRAPRSAAHPDYPDDGRSFGDLSGASRAGVLMVELPGVRVCRCFNACRLAPDFDQQSNSPRGPGPSNPNVVWSCMPVPVSALPYMASTAPTSQEREHGIGKPAVADRIGEPLIAQII